MQLVGAGAKCKQPTATYNLSSRGNRAKRCGCRDSILLKCRYLKKVHVKRMRATANISTYRRCKDGRLVNVWRTISSSSFW